MAGYNTNKYQYETSPRKLQPEYKQPKTNIKKKKNVKQLKSGKNKVSTYNYKYLFLVIIGFALFFTISYRNALIDQKFSEIKKLKSELEQIDKENQQIKINLENKEVLNTIEKKAYELGLKKASETEMIYIDLDVQDYVESSQNEIVVETDNIFDKIINKIKEILN